MLGFRKIAPVFFLTVLIGCSIAPIPDYIKADHPYIRKITGDYSAIITAIQLIVVEKGWIIKRELNPSDYERRNGGEDQSRDVLFFTVAKRNSRIFYSTYTHLNIYVHPNADGAEVDIRYEAITPGLIRQSSVRNDKLVTGIFDQIEQTVESK